MLQLYVESQGRKYVTGAIAKELPGMVFVLIVPIAYPGIE